MAETKEMCDLMGETPFEVEVLAMTQQIMASGEIEAIFKKQIEEGFKDAIKDAFRWGDLRKAIEERVKETMIPYIKDYDFGSYLVNLDLMLQEIADQTGMSQNKEIIESFRRLMSVPDEKEISFEKLFNEYNKHVAADCDTDELEVDLDDDPTYESIETHAEITPCEQRGYTHFWDYAMLNFYAEGQDELTYSVMLKRYRDDKPWTIAYDANPTLRELPNFNEFEILLVALTRFGTGLVYEEDELEDWITPDDTPEASWS